MDAIKVIEIKKSVFEDNDKDAENLRKELKDKGVFLLNLMSAPGSGKTTTLIQTLNRIKDKVRVAVMEADIDSDVDAVKIREATGVSSIQLHTGGMCHLDAEMTRQGLDNVELKDVDLVVLENVGNLVCPAEFDTGAVRNAMILSVPEGDDKLGLHLRRRDGCRHPRGTTYNREDRIYWVPMFVPGSAEYTNMNTDLMDRHPDHDERD